MDSTINYSAGIGVGTVVNWLWNNPHAILVLLWVPSGLEFLLGGLDAGSSINDISIKAEVWNKIVLRGRLSFLRWVPDMLQLLLRVLNVLFSCEDVFVFSEVWHFVANSGWMIRLISSLSWCNIASLVHACGWLLGVMLLFSFWWGTSWWSWSGTLWLQLLSFLVIWNLLKSILSVNSIFGILFNLNFSLSISISNSSLLGLSISSGSSILWFVCISFTLGKRWGILILR